MARFTSQKPTGDTTDDVKEVDAPEPATPDEVDAEGAFKAALEAGGVPVAKKPRVQTKAGRLGAAEKAAELAKKRLDKHDAKYSGAAEKRVELADALEAAVRDRTEALEAFGVTVPEGN